MHRPAYGDRVRSRLRDELLDAAYARLIAVGFERLRMTDVAAAVGVSRQTVYNTFGDKHRLAQALALRESERFLDGIDAALAACDQPYVAVIAAVSFTLTEAATNPLLKSILASAGGESLLPLLTSRSEPLLVTARSRVQAHLQRYWPDRAATEIESVADAVVRLTVSHLVLPLDPVDATARVLARLVVRALTVPPADSPEETHD